MITSNKGCTACTKGECWKIEDTEESQSSSVDTNEAFMDMLGFGFDELTSLDVDEERVEIIDIPNTNDEEFDLCSCHPINPPMKCSRHHLDPENCFALIIDDVLSDSKCQTLKELASTGFRYITEASHKAPDGTTYTVQIQNPNPHKLSPIDTLHDPSSSSTSTDPATMILDEIYDKIKTALAQTKTFHNYTKRQKLKQIKGLNPRMRVLRYDAKDNDLFSAHFDATTFVSVGGKRMQSHITVLLYLNDGGGEDFDGGETLYLNFHNSISNKSQNDSDAIKITPKTGRVVLFEHDLYHSGAPLSFGTKYIMRTDILFDEVENENIKGEEGPRSTESIENEDTERSHVLVSDICNLLEIPQNAKDVLGDVDILNCTCESILSTGVTMIKTMIIDAGIEHELASRLIKNIVESVKK